MTGTGTGLDLGWETDDLQIEIQVEDVMADLDPRWEDWAGLELVTA